MSRRVFVIPLLLAVLAAVPARSLSQAALPGFARALAITTPRQAFGASIGDDYFLASYTQLVDYWQTLAGESDRLQLVDIGGTTEGRRQWMAVISAPENLPSLGRYREISRRLSRADGLDEPTARRLAAEGKAIVWIDGGLHADETLGAQQLIALVHALVSRSDPETLRILRDTVVLVVPANPDGQDLVADWYMRARDPLRRSLAGLPRLYQAYVGHDNNRDFYMSTQAETINMNRVLAHDWLPQIVFDHHQPGPDGTVMFAPPFRDPVSDPIDALVGASLDAVGAAMHARFAAEDKPGVTMRSGSSYSTWWNGGLRTAAYFRNQVGLLTETIGDPSPMRIPFVAGRQQPSADLPRPIAPQTWRFRQSIEYAMTANYAVLDFAARHRDDLLFQAYLMGRHGIERGGGTGPVAAPSGGRGVGGRRPEARAYVLPADQPDFPTAVAFADALLKSGVQVLRATAPFAAGARRYPTGSLVVPTAQAFRPHVIDMFEPQDYPGGRSPATPATSPYDGAGWTLAFQMGIAFDRLLQPVHGPLTPITAATVPAGIVSGVPRPAGYVFTHRQNNAFIVLNRLLAAGEEVYWLGAGGVAAGSGAGPGAMFVVARDSTRPLVQRAAAELGVSFAGVAATPRGAALRIRPVRVGLWDQYGGSAASGWTRWILERFEFPFERVFVQRLDAGTLSDRYDVLILPADAVPSGRSRREDGSDIADLPAIYRETTGTMTWDRTVPQLRRFVEAGGTLLLVGGATAIAPRLGAAVGDALAVGEGAAARPLRRDEFDIPGSVLRARVDTTVPLAYGLESEVDLMFDNSPVFRIAPRVTRRGAPAGEARAVAWFGAAPLRSGWARGQEHLRGTVAVADIRLGAGRVALFGPEVTFRAQSHGAFKFLFNGIFYGRAQPVARIAPAAVR